MKKRWLFILAVLMIAATMFVACNSEVTDASASAQPGKELVYATFGNSSSKDLSVSYNFIDYTKLYWFYQATKEDSFGTTGEVTGSDWAKVPGDSEGKGLDGTVGPFSQGLWAFALTGYQTKTDSEPSGSYIHYGDYYYSDLVYSGTSIGTGDDHNIVNLKYGNSNAIPVTVAPFGETGKIALGTSDNPLSYAWNNNAGGDGSLKLKVAVTYQGATATESWDIYYDLSSDYKYNGYVYAKDSSTSTDLSTGNYNLEFTVCAVDTNNNVAYEFAKQSLSLTVFGSQTTYVKGDLVEGLFVDNAHFVATDVASVIVIPTDTGADFVTDKTPSGSSDSSKKTTVSIPTGTLTTGTQNNMTIELVSIDIAQDVASQKSWTVADDSSAVAALTISLKEVVTTTDPTTGSVTVEEKAITTFDEAVTVTTYIETGLTGVQVFYNGDLDQPTDVTYDATTGCLTFKTTHFSEFYVTSTSEILNVDTGVKYTTLAEAVDKAIDGQTLRLIKSITDPGILIDKSLVLDLYGNVWECTDVSPSETNNRAVKITAGKVVITSSKAGGKITDGYYQTQYAEQEDYDKNDSNLLYGCIRVEKDGEVEINNVTLENFRGNGLNVKVIGGKATLDNVIINSIYGGGIEVTSVEWATNKYSVLPEEIGYAKLTNCIMHQNKYYDWCSVPVSVSGGADVDVYSTEYEGVYGVYVFSSGGTINIFGGSFTADGNTDQGVFVANQVIKCDYDPNYDYTNYEHEGNYYSFHGSCNVNVYGGTINGVISVGDNRDQVLAKGGTFDHDPTAYVAPGYVAVEDTPETGLWTVKSIADEYGYLFGGGKGTEAEPFLIYDYDTMQNISELYDVGYCCYEVALDRTDNGKIDCRGDWVPVYLNGSFDGQGVEFINVDKKLFRSVGRIADGKATGALYLKDFDVTFSVHTGQGASLIHNLFCLNTDFTDVNIHGYLEGGANSAAYYNYGCLNGNLDAKMTINFHDCDVDATLVSVSGNLGLFSGMCFGGTGDNKTIINADSDCDWNGSAYLKPKQKLYKLCGVNANAYLANTSENTEVTSNVHANLTIMTPTKTDNKYTVEQVENADYVIVYVNGQFTEHDSTGALIPNANGITVTLGSFVLDWDEVEDGVIFDTISSVVFNPGSELSYEFSDGILTFSAGGRDDNTSGTISIRACQYNSDDQLIAASGELTVVEKSTYNGNWDVK